MKKLSSILIVTIALILLSSCSSINEVDENKVKDVSDKITETIINSVGKESFEKQESFNIDAENLNTLNIENTVGDIVIETHESTEAIITLTITAKSSSKKNAEELIEDFDYTVEETSNSIVINTNYNDDKIFDNSSIQTKILVSIPKNINNFEISTNVGDIDIINNEGNFDIKSNVGNITVENSQGSYNLYTDVGDVSIINGTAVGSSEMTSNTGEIEVSLNDISDADIIKAEIGVGDISFNIPKDSSFKADINEFMKDENTETNGDEHTKIELKTNVGSIDFDLK